MAKHTGLEFAENALLPKWDKYTYDRLDCQGFVERVLADCGVRKPNGTVYDWRGSNSMYRNYYQWRGTVKECENKFGMIPQGALVFTRKTDGGEVERGYHDGLGNFSHVGIYVGNGMMIHCGNPIQYASINSNYWQSHFYTFGRIR